MLSLCKTGIVVLKFGIHYWGTSSLSVLELWRDSLFIMRFLSFFHSMYPTNWRHGEPAEVKPMRSLCKRLKSMYWNSVSTFGALHQFQYHSCEEIVYFSRDLSTTFIQNIQHTEVTANQLKSYRCFQCARLESLYWNSVSTIGALLHFQYYNCEEIVYFSWDFSASFIQCIQLTDVTANQLKSNRCFHCSRL